MYSLYTLYICKQLQRIKKMKLQITENFDQKLAELYSSKVTVNLQAESKISPNEFWDSMELLAINRRAMINYKITK